MIHFNHLISPDQCHRIMQRRNHFIENTWITVFLILFSSHSQYTMFVKTGNISYIQPSRLRRPRITLEKLVGNRQQPHDWRYTE